MVNDVEFWMNHHTLIDCDRHGVVSGSFGNASLDGMCKSSKYYINYCCGLRCTDTKPESIMEQYIRLLNRKEE